MNGYGIRPLLVVGSLLVFSAQALAEDCKTGQKLYEQGLAAGKSQQWQKAKKLLSDSTAQCNRFNNWYLLGQVKQELVELDDAALAFEDARRYATVDDERALAIARYAEVQAAKGLVAQPLTLLHEARKMHSNTPAWITDLAKKLDDKRAKEPLTVAEVTRALTNKSIKLFQLDAKPSLNVSIHFKFDSTEVVDDSRQSVDVLATALMDDSLRDKHVTIVGHTDERGGEGYNTGLSEKRAETIVKALTSKYPELSQRLATRGAGEKEPLYNGRSEWDYQMNRRIEIKIAD